MECPRWVGLFALCFAVGAAAQSAMPFAALRLDEALEISPALFPDSPGAPHATLMRREDIPPVVPDLVLGPNASGSVAVVQPCGVLSGVALGGVQPVSETTVVRGTVVKPCPPPADPYKPFVVAPVRPLTPLQKGHLAYRDVTDPFNLLTVAGNSAYFIGTTPHNPYGPGMAGFGKNVGDTLAQDATGEFIGTFVVSSLFHQDPRYFRMPHASIPRRFVHAVSRVVLAQGDDGRVMPNYANLLTSPASAFISNQYVPGLATDMASTVDRIFSGFLTEPIGTLIAEFLPDVASHIHVRIVLVQNFINKITATPPQQGGTGGVPLFEQP